MALTLNTGSGGEILASDKNTGTSEHYQFVKLIDATVDSTTGIVSGNGVHGGALRVTVASDSSGQIKLAASTASIGEVSIGAATTAAGDLAKKVDVAATTSDVGVALLAKRTDTPADYSGTDGDYEPIQVSGGRVWASVQGDAAHDAAVSGNPVLIGGEAKAMDGTDPGSVAEGDASRLKTDLQGRLLVNTANPFLWSVTDNSSGAETDTPIKAAPGAGLSLYVTDVIMSSLTAQTVKLIEDSASAVDILEVSYLPANGTVNLHLKTPIKLTANKNLGYTSTAAVATSVTCCGYTAP